MIWSWYSYKPIVVDHISLHVDCLISDPKWTSETERKRWGTRLCDTYHNLLCFWLFGECCHIKPTSSSLEVFSLRFFGKWKVRITRVRLEMSWCIQLISNSRSLLFLLSIGCRQQWRRLPAEEGTCPASAGLHQLLDTEVSHSHPTWVTWFKVYISVSIKQFEVSQQWARVDRSSSAWLRPALS